jgi:DNA-binding MarR family transcriptional regulator
MAGDNPTLKVGQVTAHDYETLAAFRHALRRFLAFSEQAARAAGLTPQQHQAILAIKGRPDGRAMAIGELADHLLVKHHSAVELVDRLVEANLVVRTEAIDDRRRMVLTLTPQAEAVLADLSATHLDELRLGRGLIAQLLDRLERT